MRELQAGRTPAPVFRDRFCHPVPRLRESRWLADHGARAAIDISDGLISDARHLAVASAVRLHVRGEMVPLCGLMSVEDALASGEEYELLATCPDALDAAAFRREFDLDLTQIGEASPDGDAGVVVTINGCRVASPTGYDHFEA